MSDDDLEIQANGENWSLALAIGFVCSCIAACLFFVKNADNEHARQSVECVKAGGEWKESECVKGKK